MPSPTSPQANIHRATTQVGNTHPLELAHKHVTFPSCQQKPWPEKRQWRWVVVHVCGPACARGVPAMGTALGTGCLNGAGCSDHIRLLSTKQLYGL